MVAEDAGANRPPGGVAPSRRDHDAAGAARRGPFLPANADVVFDRDGTAAAEGRGGAGGGSAAGSKKGAIDLAYRLAEAASPAVVPGRGRAVPGDSPARAHLGARGQAGAPAPRVRPWWDRQAAAAAPPRHGRGPRQRRHERHQRRAPALAPGRGDRRARHAPPVTIPEAERPSLARWATWLGHEPRNPLPPLRRLLIWDNLAAS